MRPADGTTSEGGIPEGEVRCKLLRSDGSEWTVTDLSLQPDGLHVSGYRYIRDGHTAAEARRDVIDNEPLRPDDRVRCLNRKGAVVWTLHRPGARNGAQEAGGAHG
jgi:hypothetical protein